MSVRPTPLPGTASAEDIIQALEADGVTIVEDFFAPELIDRINDELQPHIDACRMRTLDTFYDEFLGASTVRLHGLAAKAPSYVEALIDPRVMSVMDAVLKPNCVDYRLSAAELIEIRGGETAQIIHRDDDSWPRTAQPASPLVVNMMVALSDYTEDNGATIIVPGSHKWDLERVPEPEEITQAVMPKGSVAIFTGKCLHAGGTNTSGVPRRGLSIAYNLGWLVPVENSYLGVPIETIRSLPERAQELLGYALYDGTSRGGGQINMYEVGSPKAALE